jgi:hypothetical protein
MSKMRGMRVYTNRTWRKIKKGKRAGLFGKVKKKEVRRDMSAMENGRMNESDLLKVNGMEGMRNETGGREGEGTSTRRKKRDEGEE